MKRLLKLLAISLILGGCTQDLNIDCPCMVIGREPVSDGTFLITVSGTANRLAEDGKFTFYSKYPYQIEDTIQ
jgi:hypothetical protein